MDWFKANVYLQPWRTPEMTTKLGRGYWWVRRDKTNNEYHLNYMTTETNRFGIMGTQSVYHKTFRSLQSAKQHAERQTKA